jgi:hypothetical protein
MDSSRLYAAGTALCCRLHVSVGRHVTDCCVDGTVIVSAVSVKTERGGGDGGSHIRVTPYHSYNDYQLTEAGTRDCLVS